MTRKLPESVVRGLLTVARGSSLFAALLLHPALSGAQLDLPASSAPTEELLLFQEIPSVFGASKYEQKVTEAPASVTIITADEIKKYGYRTLADILQSVNGFFVTNDRNYSYVGARGFNRPGDYNTRILILVDGHRLNDNIYDAAYVGTEAALDVALIDRVEIIRGPGSSLYGANAFLGVINVITKRGRNLRGAEFSAETGSYDSYGGRFTYGDKWSNGLEFLFSGSFYDTDGHDRLFYQEFNHPATNNGVVNNADSDRRYYLFSKSSFADFTLQGSYNYRSKRIPTGAYDTVFNTTRNETVDEHGYVDLLYTHEFVRQFQLTARAYYDRYYYHGQYLFDFSETDDPFLVLNRDFSLGEWWGSEVQVTRKFFDKHKLTVGNEYRDNFTQNQLDRDLETYVDSRENSRTWAFYFQDEFSLRDNLLLNAGVRYDHYDSFGGTVNPRLALIYNLRQTTVKLLYGEAFRAPNAYEQFYFLDADAIANAHLKPETIKTYELVLEQSLGRHMRASAAGYYYTIDDLISQVVDPNDELIFQNVDSIEAKGLELQLDGRWPSGLAGRLGYSLQHAANQDTGKRLTNSPQHMVKFNLTAPFLRERLFTGLEMRYMSERRTLAGKQASDFFIVNLTLFTQRFLQGVELSGSVYNLFAQRYGDPGGGEHRQDIIEQDGRTFWLKLQYHF